MTTQRFSPRKIVELGVDDGCPIVAFRCARCVGTGCRRAGWGSGEKAVERASRDFGLRVAVSWIRDGADIEELCAASLPEMPNQHSIGTALPAVPTIANGKSKRGSFDVTAIDRHGEVICVALARVGLEFIPEADVIGKKPESSFPAIRSRQNEVLVVVEQGDHVVIENVVEEAGIDYFEEVSLVATKNDRRRTKHGRVAADNGGFAAARGTQLNALTRKKSALLDPAHGLAKSILHRGEGLGGTNTGRNESSDQGERLTLLGIGDVADVLDHETRAPDRNE